MGAVYAARHVSIEREVAIKFLAREYAASSDLVLRFFNEARAAARIDHPGIVQIFDSGLLPDGAPYIVMELLKGESLSCRLRSSGSSTRQSIQVAWQVASAISAAHAVGIVHRDLKPDNIMLIPDPFIDGGERVKILDFGIAKLSCSRKTNTVSNVIMGTPRYMSPEQCRGAAHVDDRSDVYSLGVMLFEMLSGRALFTAENPNEYLFFHVLEAPPRLASVVEGIPAELANLVDQLLGKAAGQRPAMRQAAAPTPNYAGGCSCQRSVDSAFSPYFVGIRRSYLSQKHRPLAASAQDFFQTGLQAVRGCWVTLCSGWTWFLLLFHTPISFTFCVKRANCYFPAPDRISRRCDTAISRTCRHGHVKQVIIGSNAELAS